MKLIQILTTLTVLNLTSIANENISKNEKSACKTSTCAKTNDCGSCGKDAVSNSVSLVITGMTCEGCSDKITKALTAIEGVITQKICHKSGSVKFTYNPEKTNKTKIISVINTTGFKVAGEKLSIPVSGMTCGGCTSKVKAALTVVEGCSITSICHKSGHAKVTIDTAKTSKEKVIEAINKTGFKTQEAKPVNNQKKES